MLSLGINPSVIVSEWIKKHGPIIHLYMGIQHWVIVGDPLLANEIFIKQGSKTSGRQKHIFTRSLYSDVTRGISFTDTSKKWKKSRKLAQSMLSPENIDKLTTDIESVIDIAVDCFLQASDRDGAVDPFPFIKMCTFSVMLKTFFGKTIESLENPLLQDIIYMADGIVKYISPEQDIGSFLPLFSWINRFSSQRKEMTAISELRNNTLLRLVKEAVEGDADCLVKRVHGLKESYGLDDDDLISLLGDLLAAGGDPTSVSLDWLFLLVAQYKDVQQKLCAEIDAFVAQNGRLPSFSDRASVPYLQAVLLETIRFKSITNFGIAHRTTEDIECLGYFIPENTLVMVSMSDIHMNKDKNKDPEQFMPERFLGRTSTWLSNSRANIQERDMYAFGWGRRICLGVHLSEVELFNVCVRTFGRYNIELPLGPDGLPQDILSKGSVFGGLTSIPHKYKVKVIKRRDIPLQV
ncbi:cytochrome P450 [Phycomyces nitens]|nr:cytochrome P450 [Phycomyces nitens]